MTPMSISLTFLFLLLNFLSLTSADAALIEKACQNTKHYDLCVSSLKPNPTSSKTDIKGLAKIMARIGKNNATATSAYLSSSSSAAPSNDTILKKVMKECADKYRFSSDALRSSETDLAAENYDSAYVEVSAAAEYPNACHNAFRRYQGLVYPAEVAKREEALVEICDVLLGIVDYIINVQSK